MSAPDDNDVREIDAAVIAYRERLREAGTLRDASLDEIEDHLRELIAELRETLPLAQAVREAAERMGEPADIAREHARVETSFGAPLPPWRAWIAAALTAVPLAYITHAELMNPGDPMMLLKLVPLVIIIGALAARSTAARALLLAQVSCWTLNLIYNALSVPGAGAYRAWYPFAALAFVLIAPWKRREMTVAGWGLFLAFVGFERLSRQYVSAGYILDRTRTYGGHDFALTHGLLVGGLVAALIAIVMMVLRSRWAAVPALFAGAITLLSFRVQLSSVVHVAQSSMPIVWWFMVHLMLGAFASMAAAYIAWRSSCPFNFISRWRTA